MSKIIKDVTPKGPAAEEKLRNYFLGVGYFVLRGIKFKFENFDVTDVDLWLYGRNSPFSRERVNVDIKNKKTPQALERIFWAKGLQSVLGLDSCIVATTDIRHDVGLFGLQHGVKVLDGRFLSRLDKSEKSHLERITEEKFLNELETQSLGKLGGDWKGRYEQAKSRVLDNLNFDGCNAWLADTEYFLGQAISSGTRDSCAWRMVYFCVSLFLISLDFILRDHVALEQDQRRILLENGFRYGQSGQAFVEKIGRLASVLVESAVAQPGLHINLQKELNQTAMEVKAEILSEYFSKNNIQSALFERAAEFEFFAFSLNTSSPSALPTNVQSILAVLADFFKIDREKALL